MQFSKIASILLAAATAAVAAPTDGGEAPVTQCCSSTETAPNFSGPTQQLFNLLGINVSDVTGIVGINCSPITVVGNAQCSGQTVQCNDNSFKGVVALGCVVVTA